MNAGVGFVNAGVGVGVGFVSYGVSVDAGFRVDVGVVLDL